MDTTKQLAKAVINKDFAQAKDLVFKSLYARASLALDEARYSVSQSIYNSTTEVNEDSWGGGFETSRGKAVKEETEQLDEVMTRKHFQQVADVIKAHPDAKKREELAAHHSQIFKKSNPRFDEGRFRKACGIGGCKEGVEVGGEQLDEVSPPGMEKMTGSPRVKASFKKQYGKRGKSVMYATAWKLHNKKKD